jgi:hypothetical protein
LGGSLAALVVQIAFIFWTRRSFGLPIGAAIAAGVTATAGCVYLAQLRRKVRLPELLLRIDRALGLEARISSLYELRLRGRDRVLRRRIEQRVGSSLDDWRRAMPPARAGWLTSILGVLSIAAILAFSALPVPAAKEPVVTGDEATAPRVERSAAAAQTEPFVPTPQPLDAVPSHDRTDLTMSVEQDAVRLDMTLQELGELDAPTAITGETGMQEIGDLLARQRNAARALSEMLERMQQRMQQEGGGLTEQERRQLRAAMGEELAPQTEQAVRDALSETDPDRLQQKLEDLAATLSDSTQNSESGDGEISLRIALDEQDDWEPASPPGEETSTQEQGSPTPTREGQTSTDGDIATPPGDSEEDWYQETGGTQGIEPEMQESEDQTADFTAEETPFSIGDEGEFTDFLSKGVPIEGMPEERTASVLDVISFAQVDALLRARGLPADAIDIVREYFKRITEGGP